MNYQEMSVEELTHEKSVLEEQFNEYKNLLKEVYDNMTELSEKYGIGREAERNSQNKSTGFSEFCLLCTTRLICEFCVL